MPYWRFMLRRVSIFLLAAVVSGMATQPLPVRARGDHERCVIVWQHESRVSRPAEIRVVVPAQPQARAILALSQPVFLTQQVLAAIHSPRAPPLIPSATI